MKTILAFDFGASSGRALKAVFDGEKITYEEIHRFENIPIEENGHIHHDVDMIMRQVDIAIEKAGRVDSLAFDTWGVDYGLLDKNGRLLNLPYHYRDTRTEDAAEKAEEKISSAELYRETGNQIMNINTLFQLSVDENVGKAEKLLFMPDLFGYLLTGNMACEHTIASTSQMLDPKTKKWSKKVTDTFGIDRNLFAELKNTSTVLGKYKGIDVITIAGHDTQCAVAAMPVDDDNAAFLSCGTWSLIGCELDEPILDEKSSALELSNELGANSKINYLKNISGLWLIQELKRDFAARGEKYTYNDLEMLARKSERFMCFIDPDSPSLSAHGNLTQKIKDYCKATGQRIPESVGELVRCVYESLALKYRYALEQISLCTEKSFTKLNMLGGGTKDTFLCQMTADCINMPVVAGPVEATALGNIILQLIALGEISSVKEGRQLIAKSEKLITYKPCHLDEWDKAYEKYLKIQKTDKGD